MKRYLLLLSLAFSSFAYCQTQPHANQDTTPWFVDSVRTTAVSVAYIKPEDIKEIYLSEDFVDKATNRRGAIFVTTKNPKAYNLIGLEEIKKTHGINVSGAAIYMVDDQFIKDTQNFKLPASEVHHIFITKGNEFDNLKNELPGLSIVKIITNKNLPESKGLMIRGKAN